MSGTQLRTRPLRAGAGCVDITPPMGTQLAGDIGRYRPAELLLDPIYAKTLVLESEGRRLCFLSADLLAITKSWSDEIRRLASEKFGLDREAVMVHATQTHAAPALGHSAVSDDCTLIPPELSWLRGGDDRYHPFAVDRMVEAVRVATEALEPAVVGAASGIESRVAFNRRFVMRDGTVRTHPPAQELPNVLHVEGPTDPELGVMCVSTESLRIPAMLLSYTCHPTHGYPHRYVTADWPGAWCDEVRQAYGSQCVPIVLNGCCGNIHHSNHLDPTRVSDHRRMGHLLAETTHKVLKEIAYQDNPLLDWRVKYVRIPLRELDPKDLQEARKLLADHPEPLWTNAERTTVSWDWVYAASRLDLQERRQRKPDVDYEIQAFRVGDVAFAALGGEPFVEGQLRIKQLSPARRTYVAHMANGYVGYIPTRHALQGGGYETRTANWSSLAPEALDIITDETVQLLQDLFRAEAP